MRVVHMRCERRGDRVRPEAPRTAHRLLRRGWSDQEQCQLFGVWDQRRSVHIDVGHATEVPVGATWPTEEL